MANQNMRLTVGGPVQVQAGTYLPRPADEQLLKACQTDTFAYVLACRQIGKSSLMFATSEKLTRAGVRTALIDLNSIGQNVVDSESWYFTFVDELARNLRLDVDAQTWWDRRPRLSTLTQRFLQFLRDVVLEEIAENIVIFVDEIDMTLGLDFTDDFFAAIRSVYNDRAQYPTYQRLTFVLLGVATPDELIRDQMRTPFNIGQAITLRDFTKQECDPFRLELESNYPDQGRSFFDQVYEWTSGHPLLTQKLCAAIIEQGSGSEEGDPGLVDRLVERHFLAPEARGDDNIQFVQNRVAGDPHAQEMLRIYKRVLERKKAVQDDDQSPAINRLKLYGLVVAKDGKLELRNRLYARAFDMSWAEEMLRLASTSIQLGLPPGRFNIVQQIGQGGFSTVYLAQTQDADKTQSVALKVLKADSIDDDNRVKRFRQEARAIAKLEHPNIIRILDTSGEEEPFYIAMEYIAGGTLRDRLKSGPLSRDEAMHIVRHIGAALDLAHGQGIVHRDIKPGNILLDTDRDPVRPVLTDFGLVKVLIGDDFTKIESAAILGTLDYMAPEQWRQETPTPATDIYALAITFFEMLAGQRPFVSDVGYYDLMNKHLEQPLPHLSDTAPEIGPFFDEVLLKAAAKEPADRFDSTAKFIEALGVANQRAEQAERIEQQTQAAKMVDVAEDYVQSGRYDPKKALSMIEIALEMCPGYVDALRLRAEIRMRHGQFEAALEDYQQAYEQVRHPASEIGIEYLEALSQVAEALWGREEYAQAAEYYEQIRQTLDGEDHEEASIDGLWQEARSRLVEYHHLVGDTAYAEGEPEDIDETIRVLDKSVRMLVALGADHESQILEDKLRLLEVNKYERVIHDAQAAIKKIKTQNAQARYGNEDIFQHYLAIDEAYQALLRLKPENEVWEESRRQNLIEWAETRRAFASHALEKPEADYEAALRHYRAIFDIEETKCPGIAQELDLHLDEKIAELEAKADFDGKYKKIRKLIDTGDYLRALDHLEQEFIRTGNYEHRDVARWFWVLVYAKQHEGKFPPEWESLSGFDTLSKRLVRMERARIQGLKDKLKPWPLSRIFETIHDETKVFGDYEEQVEGIEALINEAVAHGLAGKPEVKKCRDELDGVKAQVEKQRHMLFEMDKKEMGRRVDVWLQELSEIEELLQTGNPLKDIPIFLERSDRAQETIEADPLFARLGALETASAKIQRTIQGVELGIQGRLWRVLVEDVGSRDEELSRLRGETERLEAELTQARDEAARRQTVLAGAREEISELRQKEASLKQQKGKHRQQYELNRYIIPISLILALITGGIIAPQIKLLSELPIITWITLGLLIAYFVYYVWVYYVRSDAE